MSNLQLAKVLYRNLTNPLRTVSPEDFTSTNSVTFNAAELVKLSPLIPYAIDVKKRTVTYSAKVNLLESLKSTFLYDYLRRSTDYTVSVPISNGNLSQIKKIKMPIFIFSTGRCGSTLFTKITSLHQKLTLSEPDFYTQLSTFSKEVLTAKDKMFLFNHLTADLVNAYQTVNPSDELFVKLRAECNSLPQLFIKNKEQKTIFLSRDFSSWSRSVLQHFNNPKIKPEIVVHFYIKALHTLDFLSKNSSCTHIRYDQLIDQSNDQSIQLLQQAISCPIDNLKLTEVMAKDSQSGSAVGQDQKKSLDKDKYSACLTLFKKHMPTDLMNKYQILFEQPS
jgi:hypothetical protein